MGICKNKGCRKVVKGKGVYCSGKCRGENWRKDKVNEYGVLKELVLLEMGEYKGKVTKKAVEIAVYALVKWHKEKK